MIKKVDPQNKGKSLLVVDDEESIAKLISAILKRYGFENVTTVTTGYEALKLVGVDHPSLRDCKTDIESKAVDVVLLDIMLPNLNGFEVCKAIKNSSDRDIVIILITGFEIEHHHARYIESGADDFLIKPINPKELVNRVEMHLARRAKSTVTGKPAATFSPSQPATEQLELKSIGPYSLTRSLSWSGSVVVYEACKDDLKCVVKILTRQAMEYDDVVMRFQREGQLLSTFDHPNVIRLLDRGEHNELEYYVMEFIEGRNLEAFCAEQSHPDLPFIHNVARSVASALEHVHSHGVVHRDIKLKNIFIDNDDTVKIGDFGIALSMGDLRLTQTGYAIGTPIYMAPEQFEGKNVTPSADIYSFGASLYHLITGLPPFTAGNAMELLRKHLHEKPPSIRARRAGIPKGWDELIVDHCLAKKTADRPADMSEVIRTLEKLKP